MFKWLKDLFKTDRELDEEWIKEHKDWEWGVVPTKPWPRGSVPMKPTPPPPIPSNIEEPTEGFINSLIDGRAEVIVPRAYVNYARKSVGLPLLPYMRPAMSLRSPIGVWMCSQALDTLYQLYLDKKYSWQQQSEDECQTTKNV